MNDLIVSDIEKTLACWDDSSLTQTIKDCFAKGLTNSEFKVFVEMGKSLGLNPFLREVWAVKFGGNPPQIFVGRDGYRKVISRSDNYDYTMVDAVYANDEFTVTPDGVIHKYTLTNRGKLMGAYCTVKMKKSSRPFYAYVSLDEYDLNHSLWKTKKATMIKKVAEAQCLRMACTALHGTYDESENWYKDSVEGSVSSNAKAINEYDSHLQEQETETVINEEPIIIEDVPDKFIQLKDQLELCQSMEEISLVTSSIAKSGINKQQRAELVTIYKAVMSKITSNTEGAQNEEPR